MPKKTNVNFSPKYLNINIDDTAEVNKSYDEFINQQYGEAPSSPQPIMISSQPEQDQDEGFFSAVKKSAIYARLTESKEDMLANAHKWSQALGLPEDTILYDHENYERVRDIYSKSQSMKDLIDYDSEPGMAKINFDKLYDRFTGLKDVVDKGSTIEAALLLKNIQDVKQTQGIIFGNGSVLDFSKNGGTKGFFGEGSAVGEGWNYGANRFNKAIIYAKSLGNISREDIEEGKKLDEELKDVKEAPNFFNAPMQSMIYGAMQSAPDMLVSEAAGRVAGAVAGGVAGGVMGLPGGLPGVAAGAVTGAWRGAATVGGVAGKIIRGSKWTGNFLGFMTGAQGRYFEDELNRTDANGRLINTPQQAWRTAVSRSTINSAIETASFGMMKGALSGAVKEAAPGIAARLASRDTAAKLAEIISTSKTEAIARGAMTDLVASEISMAMKVAGTETTEEMTQELADVIIDNLQANSKRKQGYDTQNVGWLKGAERVIGAGVEALPAAMGFGMIGGAIGVPASAYKGYKLSKDYNDLIGGVLDNRNYNSTLDQLKASPELISNLKGKAPEAQNTVLQAQFDKVGMGKAYVDLDMLRDEDGGENAIRALASAENLTEAQADDMVFNQSQIEIKSSTYAQNVLDTEHDSVIRKHITLNPEIPTLARTEEFEKISSRYKELMDTEIKDEPITKYLDVNFPESGMERDLATQIISARPEDPYEQWKDEVADTEGSINEISEAMATNPDNMNQEQKNKLDELKNKKAILAAIGSRIKNLDKEEMEITAALNKDGYEAYKTAKAFLAQSVPDKQKKTVKGSAAILARMAQSYAKAMNEAGYKDYTVGDYMKTVGIKYGFDGKQSANLFNQPITNSELNLDGKIPVLDLDAMPNLLQGKTPKDVIAYIKKISSGPNNRVPTADFKAMVGLPENVYGQRHLIWNKGSAKPYNQKAVGIVLSNFKDIISKATLVEISENKKVAVPNGSQSQIKTQKRKNAVKKYYRLFIPIKLNEKLQTLVITAEDFNGRVSAEPQTVVMYEVNAIKNKNAFSLSSSPVESSVGATMEGVFNISIRDALTNVKDVDGVPYINKDGTGNFQTFFQSAFHGSPYKFDEFTLDHIGSGEGAQAHGWGLYFSLDKGTAEKYRNKLSREFNDEEYSGKTLEGWIDYFAKKSSILAERVDDDDSPEFIHEAKLVGREYLLAIKLQQEQNFNNVLDFAKQMADREYEKEAADWFEKTFSGFKALGQVYEVDIPNNEVMLLEDKDYTEQSETVKKALNKIFAEHLAEHFEGVPENMTGGRLYKNIVFELQDKGSDRPKEDASKLLNSYGIQGIRYNGTTDGECAVVFDDKAIQILNTFYQKNNGSILIGKNERIIELFETANASTFIHELGHLFLDDFQRLAQTEGISAATKKDFETVLEWLGMKSVEEWNEWQQLADKADIAMRTMTLEKLKKAIETEQDIEKKQIMQGLYTVTMAHEKFANGFMAYLATAKAPTRGLKAVMRKFKRWLLDVYTRIMLLDYKPSKDVEAVFNRMLTVEGDVDTTAETIDTKLDEKVKEAAKEKVLRNLLDQYKGEPTEAEITTEGNRYRTSLESQELWQLNELWLASGKNDAVLEANGYSKDDFAKRIAAAGGSIDNAVKAHIDSWMSNRMTQVDPEQIEKMVNEELGAGTTSIRMATEEYSMLAKQLESNDNEQTRAVMRGTAKAIEDNIRTIAKERIDALPVGQASSVGHWLQKAAGAARRYANAMRADLTKKGALDKALAIKEEQLLYATMARLAVDKRDATNKVINNLRRMANIMNRKESTQFSAAEKYHYNMLMYKLGLAENEPNKPTLTDIPTLEGLFARYDADCETVGTPDSSVFKMINDLDGYAKLSQDDFEIVTQKIMKVLYTVGRDSNIMKTNGMKIDDAVQDIALKMKLKTDDYGTVEEPGLAKSFARGVQSQIISPETMLIRLFGGENNNGYDLIFNTLQKAAFNKGKLQNGAAKEFKALSDLYSYNERWHMSNDKKYKTKQGRFTKEMVIMLALNWGNKGNRKRIEDNMGLDTGEAENLLATLDARDWQFVSGVWELINKYWDKTVQNEEFMTGMKLKPVEPEAFVVEGDDGQTYALKGGYFPIAYNPKKSSSANEMAANDITGAQMIGVGTFNQGLGFTKERAGHVKDMPLLLDFSVISNHLDDVTNNIAMRAAVRDVAKILNNKFLAKEIADRMGEGALAKLKTWVSDTWKLESTNRNAQGLEKGIRTVRINSNIAIMGYRLSTALLNAANLPLVMNEIGTVDTLKALANFYNSDLKQNWQRVMLLSPELEERARSMDVNIKETVSSMKPSKVYGLDVVQRHAYDIIAATDLMLSAPLYLHVYDKVYNEKLQEIATKNQGAELTDADIANADMAAKLKASRSLRKVFGSGSTIHLSAIQKTEIGKLITPFYSFFNAQLNTFIAANAESLGKKWTARAGVLLKNYLMIIILQAAMETVVRQMIGSGDDDDDFYKAWAKNALNTTAAGIPLGSAFTTYAISALSEGKQPYVGGRATFLALQPIERAEAFILTVGKMLHDKGQKNWIDAGREFTKTLNAGFGIPDTPIDAIWTTLKWGDNNFEASLWDYLKAVAFDRKLDTRKGAKK